MKKTAFVLLLVTLVCCAGIPSFAQRARPIQNAGVRGFIVEYERIDALTDGQGVFLRWYLKTELGNTGFLIYRSGDQGLELVTRSLILGSFAKVGQRTQYGTVYEHYDPSGTLGSNYVIENLFTNGNRTSTAPFDARFTANFENDTGYTKAQLEQIARSRKGDLRRGDLQLPSDLQAVVTGSIQPPNLQVQREVATLQGVKIAVKQEGIYRVTRAELQTAGFDVNSDSANWRLFTDGNEQAIIVGAGAQYIDFYGKTLDTRYTDTRTYFLILDTVAGKRMVTKFLGNIGGNVVSKNYSSVIEKKERTSYADKIRNGYVENYWGNAIISSPPTNETFNLTSIDPNGLNAVVTVKVQGITLAGHGVRVFLNDNDLGTMTGFGEENFSRTFSVPPSFLVEGINTLRLNTRLSSDQCLFDKVTVSYARKYAADQNKVPFFAPGYRRVDLAGFSSPNIRVFDTTLDGHPQLITDLAVIQNAGGYTVRIPANRPAVYYGVEDSAFLVSPSVTPNSPSTLSSPNNLADVIIISHSDPTFIAAAETWASYRRSAAGGSFAAKVVDVADIFDEFSFGEPSDFAVKNFLEYAKTNWQTPGPRYVLIIGDGSRDPRNYEGRGFFDFVPTKSVELIYAETGSDEALGDFNNDGLAELAIGRIPARTASAITTVFNKTTGFETPAMQSLDRGAVFPFDMPFGFDFEAMSHFLRDQLPASMPATFIGRGLPNEPFTPDPNAHTNLMNALNAGKYLAVYSGHGSAGVWASPAFFSSNDVPALTNANAPSIFMMLTCLNGYFIWPQSASLGEVLLTAPNGGAVASWASTTETTPDYQMTMGAPFLQQISLGNIKRMGDLVLSAKASVAGSDVGYSWTLLGDPMLKVRE